MLNTKVSISSVMSGCTTADYAPMPSHKSKLWVSSVFYVAYLRSLRKNWMLNTKVSMSSVMSGCTAADYAPRCAVSSPQEELCVTTTVFIFFKILIILNCPQPFPHPLSMTLSKISSWRWTKVSGFQYSLWICIVWLKSLLSTQFRIRVGSRIQFFVEFCAI